MQDVAVPVWGGPVLVNMSEIRHCHKVFTHSIKVEYVNLNAKQIDWTQNHLVDTV